MRKLICLMIVCLMAASVRVSASERPVLTYEIHTAMKTAVWNTEVVTPLSSEMRQEIQDAWLAQKGTPMTTQWQDLYYYGTYDGSVVFLEPLPPADVTTIVVAGVTIYWGSCYAVHVYRAGEFLSLVEAYEQNWLADGDIQRIAYYSEASNMNIEYYGEYDGCYVGFIDVPGKGYAEVALTVTIAGVDFSFSDTHQLTVCKDGVAKNLDKAYEAGWLSDGEVQRLWNAYTNGIFDENPDTSDSVWMPMALLVTSGAAMALVIGRKSWKN